MINIIEKIINKILDLLKIKKEKQENILQFIKFGIVGFSNVIVSYIINILTLLILKKYYISYDYIIGNITSFILSVLWSFYWNNKFVFKSEKDTKKTILIKLMKTYIAYSFSCIILNNLLSIFWIRYLKISKFIAPLLNLVITIPINYILNKVWAFKK